MNKDLRSWNPLVFTSLKDARAKGLFLGLLSLGGPLAIFYHSGRVGEWAVLGLLSYGFILISISWLFNKRVLTDGDPRMKGWWLLVTYLMAGAYLVLIMIALDMYFNPAPCMDHHSTGSSPRDF